MPRDAAGWRAGCRPVERGSIPLRGASGCRQVVCHSVWNRAFGSSILSTPSCERVRFVTRTIMELPKKWRGRTVYYSGDPYPRVLWRGHPMAHRDGLVRIHRVVAAEALGRTLRHDEHVHHKDENRLNWNADNLEVISGPAHSSHHHADQEAVQCSVCGQPMERPQSRILARVFCGATCAARGNERAAYPDDDALSKMVWSEPLRTVARSFGVSEVALRKRLVKRGLPVPPRGYWQKSRGS